MQIWIHLNGIQQGPYTLDQLKLLPINAETPVWYNGLPQWTPAGQAPATAPLFGAYNTTESGANTPTPAATTIQHQNVLPPKPPTYLVWNILFTVLCCCPVSIAGIVTGAISSSRYSSGDYDGARRMSHATEWLLIISIVWILLSLPVSIIMACL